MYRRLVFLVLAMVLLGGCSQLGRQWSNFSAYHNTFYNARLSFEEGVRAVEDPEPTIDRGKYLPVFGTLRSVSNPEPFEEAIRRSADVLRKHPNSRWVEEALMIIGRSYLYLENHVGAEQKFHEVIALESSYTQEAYYWLGRTLVEAEKYDEAGRVMEEALERESLSRTWMGRYYLVAGRARLEEGALEEAADLLERGARAVPERRLETRAWFLVGQVQETLERYPEAIAAYERAETRTFDVDLAYEATVGRVRSMTSAGGHQAEALRILNLLQRQPAYEHKQSELAYLEAKVYLSQGDDEEAQDRFRELLAPERSVPREVGSRIHYALAEMYSDRNDLVTAAAHYDSAAAMGTGSSSPQSGSATFAPGILQNLEHRRNAYQAYATAQEQVEHLDSLLHLGTLPEEEFEQFVLDLRARRLEERQDDRRESDASSSTSSWESYEDDELLEEAAELDVSDSEPGSAGFLFHRDRARVQEGQIAFVQRWGDRPLTPNWRRRAAARLMETPDVPGQETMEMVQAEDTLALAETGEQPSAAGALPEVDVSEVPRDEQARAEMMERRTRLQFEAANALFLQLNRPDSAAAIYETILREHPDREIAVRAHYALAETQRVLGNTDRSEALYRELAERYPESEFASRAREMVGEEITTPVAPEADLDAELQFQEAMARWEQGDVAYALGSMLVLAERHRETGLAPRALYAATRIFRDWADRNGYDELPPLATALPAPVIEAAGFSVHEDTSEVSAEMNLLPREPVIGMRLVEALPSGPGLTDIYRRLVERYPDTEQAGRAQHLLALLDPEGQDEAPEEGIAAADEEPPEDRMEDSEATAGEVLPGPEDGTFQRTIDWQAGRWTIIIVSWPQIEHAQRSATTFRSRLADEGVDVDILALEDESGQPRYYVGVGQFTTEMEAQELLEALQGRLPDQARVERVREQAGAL